MVVLARLGQTVVDGSLVIDEANALEPVPLTIGHVVVPLSVGHSVGQMGGDREVQLVGDGVDIVGVEVRIDARVTAG